MAVHAPSIRELPKPQRSPRSHPEPSDPLDFFRGLVVALPISLLLWVAIFRAAWWLWRG